MGKLVDITGQRFGRLEVLERDTETPHQKVARWICRCDCGNVKSISGQALRNGTTLSCGCLRTERGRQVGRSRMIDLTGQHFGRLTVLRRDTYTDEEPYWVCECECGEITSVAGYSLRKGLTRSCGCLRREKTAETGRRNLEAGTLIDLTGQRFGRLTALKKVGTYRSRPIWECQCDCGNRVRVLGTNLRSHNTRSCGCLRSEIASEIGRGGTQPC